MSLKVFVGIPFSGRFVPPEFAMALAALNYPMNTSRTMAMTKGVKRDQARTELIKMAQQTGAEYMLMLDDDTVPPPYTVCELMAVLDQSDEKVAVAGGIYTNKSLPASPMVFKGPSTGPFWKWKFNEIFDCWGLGTGCMMIRMSVFDTLPEPWFRDIECLEQAIGDETALPPNQPIPNELRMTDDMYFCHKLEDYGFKLKAHGAVLPLHFSQEGKPYYLAPNSYPMSGGDCRRLWYANLLEMNGIKLPEKG